jgi:hypothetical protein
MTTTITLKDITIHPVVEQQGPFFDVMEFFPTLTKELLEENRSWLQPTFIDPVSGRLVLCVQSFVIKTPHHNILIDSCVGNHKPRLARPFWNMMNSDRFEKGLAAAGLTANDIDYVMCTHLHVDHVGWNTRLENGRWVPTFPKAKYVMADRELAYWTQKEKDDPSGVPRSYDRPLLRVDRRDRTRCAHNRRYDPLADPGKIPRARHASRLRFSAGWTNAARGVRPLLRHVHGHVRSAFSFALDWARAALGQRLQIRLVNQAGNGRGPHERMIALLCRVA